MKYRIKNCPDCQWWQSERKEFCAFHKSPEDQPPGIEKAIKKEKKELQKWRIILWTITGILGLFFLFLLFVLPQTYEVYQSGIKGFEGKYLFWENIGSIIKCGFCLLILIWMIIDIEKETQKTLKELSAKKKEWIIEK